MIFTVVFLLLSQMEQYPWLEVSRDQQRTHYVDILSIRASGERRFLRHRIDRAAPLPSGTVTAEYEVEINCQARTIAVLESEEWDEDAQTVQSRTYARPTLHPIHPNSVAQRFFELACDPAPSTSPITA
jgi:surface-adhesin protein E